MFPFTFNSFLISSSYILCSWTEFFPGNDLPPDIQGCTQLDQYNTINAGNFYVSQVTFTTIDEITGNGGAIFINTTTNLLVESSNFIQCHSKGYGGALFYDNLDAKCFIKKVCSTNSYSSSSCYHFCCISSKGSDQHAAYIDQSSVSYLYSTNEADTNIYIYSGDNVVIKYDNISKNECSALSALYYIPTVGSSISYTSFENNTSSYTSTSTHTDIFVMGFDNEKEHNMNTCNIIGNTAYTAIILVSGSLKISNSCLIENNNKPMFFFPGGSVNNDTCIINNCTIDNTEKVGAGSVIVNSSQTPSKSFISNLNIDECFSNKEINNKCKFNPLNMNKYNRLRIREDFILVLS